MVPACPDCNYSDITRSRFRWFERLFWLFLLSPISLLELRTAILGSVLACECEFSWSARVATEKRTVTQPPADLFFPGRAFGISAASSSVLRKTSELPGSSRSTPVSRSPPLDARNRRGLSPDVGRGTFQIGNAVGTKPDVRGPH